jgi:hypothetical protein
VYVETDASPWRGWVFKDGNRVGFDAMRSEDGGYRYERGRVHRPPAANALVQSLSRSIDQ